MRIGSVSGIAGRGDSSLIRPVPDAETLPLVKAVTCLGSSLLKVLKYHFSISPQLIFLYLV